MNILQNYTKSPSDPLQSVTIKLPQDMLKAIRRYNINLGAAVRDMLQGSDLMQKYKQESEPTSDLADCKEEYFVFEHEQCRYYKDHNNYWQQDGTSTFSIKKGAYYKKLAEYKEAQDEQ